MGSRSRPHRVLSVCVCVCVSRCLWVCVIEAIRSSWESSPLGYISSCHALPLVRSLQFAVDVYEAFLVPGFRDSWALLLSWTPIAGDSSAHCFPALPASAPTESSVSAYGKLRFCLRKAPRLPTEAPPLCLRKALFSFSLCITSCNKLSFSATESSRLHCDSNSYAVSIQNYLHDLKQMLITGYDVTPAVWKRNVNGNQYISDTNITFKRLKYTIYFSKTLKTTELEISRFQCKHI